LPLPLRPSGCTQVLGSRADAFVAYAHAFTPRLVAFGCACLTRTRHYLWLLCVRFSYPITYRTVVHTALPLTHLVDRDIATPFATRTPFPLMVRRWFTLCLPVGYGCLTHLPIALTTPGHALPSTAFTVIVLPPLRYPHNTPHTAHGLLRWFAARWRRLLLPSLPFALTHVIAIPILP